MKIVFVNSAWAHLFVIVSTSELNDSSVGPPERAINEDDCYHFGSGIGSTPMS
jgi:hypothetical protein